MESLRDGHHFRSVVTGQRADIRSNEYDNREVHVNTKWTYTHTTVYCKENELYTSGGGGF